tara:strand:+ start:47335 stop:49044 length:1710 start_codon:yes stop_codon:yes gene_type:complete
MLDTITCLFERSNKPQLGHVVWLGCGLANDANSICALKPTKLVLAEAIEELTNKLERRFQGSNIVDIVNYCISSDGKPTVFFHTQPRKFSSLQEPTGLVNYYPNTVVDSVFEHPTISANSLLSSYELNPNYFNVLILELNGYEQALVPHIEKQYLHQFDAIVIAQTIHYDVSNKEQLEQEMDQLAFQLTDSEGSHRAYLRNDTQLRVQLLENLHLEFQEKQKHLESDNEILFIEKGSLEAQIAQLQQNNQDLNEINENAVAHIHQLLNDNEQLEAKESELLSSIASLESRLSNLESSNSSLETYNSDLIKENADLTRAKKTVEQEREQLKVESGKVQGERDKAQGERNLAQSRVNELTQQLEQHKQQSEAEQSELLSRLSQLESNNSSLETRNSDLITENAELTEVKKLVEQEREKLKVERDEAKSQIESKVKLLEEVTKRAEKEEAEFVSRLSTLESELEERTKQRDSEHKWHQENKNWAESLNKQIEQLKTDLAEKSRSASLGQKMLAKAQIDLDHLRESYADKVQSEKELVELVRELREKLTLASKYYIKLQQEHPELISSQTQEI